MKVDRTEELEEESVGKIAKIQMKIYQQYSDPWVKDKMWAHNVGRALLYLIHSLFQNAINLCCIVNTILHLGPNEFVFSLCNQCRQGMLFLSSLLS